MSEERLEQALFEIRRVIAGQDAMLERVLVCLLAQGHLLIEGVPGLAKTLTIKTTAAVLGGSFARIQFTPDLVPADLVGTRVYRPDTGTFETELGPVFCNFLLADEINRAPAKVQSALLEVMQERQVTIAHTSYPVPDPFLVLATQNPIESDGTYLLPEAQLDRFMFKVLVDYPSYDEELVVVQRVTGPRIELRTLLDFKLESFNGGFEVAFVLGNGEHFTALNAFDQHLDVAVRLFQVLNDIRHRADRENFIGARFVDARIMLGREENFLVAGEGLV